MVALTFKNEYLQNTLKKWCKFKTIHDGDDEDRAFKDDEIMKHDEFPEIKELKEQIARVDGLYEEWKLRTMGLALESHVIVTKELEAKFASSSNFINPN